MIRKLLSLVMVGACAACGDTSARVAAVSGAAATDSVVAGQTVESPPGGETEYYSSQALSRIAESLAKGTNPTRVFGRHPALWYVAARRNVSGSAEIHDRWIDVTFIQAGKGVLLSGGTVTGARLESTGEHRGGTINGGSKRAIGAGDFLVIPAGVPHQYQLAPGDSLVYLTVKVLSQPVVR